MSPPYDDPESMDGEEGEENEGDEEHSSADLYAKAGRTIRHALADGDDEAVGEAICKLIESEFPQLEKEGDEPGGKKPNLAAILIASKKRK